MSVLEMPSAITLIRDVPEQQSALITPMEAEATAGGRSAGPCSRSLSFSSRHTRARRRRVVWYSLLNSREHVLGHTPAAEGHSPHEHGMEENYVVATVGNEQYAPCVPPRKYAKGESDSINIGERHIEHG